MLRLYHGTKAQLHATGLNPQMAVFKARKIRWVLNNGNVINIKQTGSVSYGLNYLILFVLFVNKPV